MPVASATRDGCNDLSWITATATLQRAHRSACRDQRTVGTTRSGRGESRSHNYAHDYSRRLQHALATEVYRHAQVSRVAGVHDAIPDRHRDVARRRTQNARRLDLRAWP